MESSANRARKWGENGAEVGRKWGGSGEKVGRTRFGGKQHKVFLNDKKWDANGAEMGLCYLVRQEKESRKSPQLHPKRNRNPK